MISQTAEYALRAVVSLATYPDESLTTRQIGKITKAPIGYLSKVLQSLGKAGLVLSQRGLHGGFVLSRPAKDISLLEVINAVDPIHSIHSCPLGIEEHGKELCPLHARLNEAVVTLMGVYGKTSVGELVAKPGRLPSMCILNEKRERSEGKKDKKTPSRKS